MADVMINPERLELAEEIFKTLADLRPEKSLSFTLAVEGAEAVEDALLIVEWGIGGNKPKLKEAALEVVSAINEVPHGQPVNVNLTEYEIKAMGEVVEAVNKAGESHKEGVLP